MANTKDNVEEVRIEYAKIKEKASKEYSRYRDNRDPSAEEKKQIRLLFSECSKYANKLSEIDMDPKNREGYKKDFSFFVEKLQNFGSTLKGSIPTTKFDDVKGLKEVKGLIQNFMILSSHPEILKAYKLSSSLGMLMYGPPGTGKTLIAEAIANELQVPFFLVTPSDIFKSHVGESEEAVKLLFYDLECCTDGAVLFIDECESIFANRDMNTERYQQAVTTELLQRMNGFGVSGKNRVIIAATNRPEMIDPAYLRFKRFSHLVYVDLPDAEAKKAIISSKLNGMPLDPNLSIDDIIKLSIRPGKNYSGADLCGIIEKTALKAIDVMREKGLTTPINLSYEMFEESFNNYPESVSNEMIARYKEFGENRKQ